MTTYGCTVQWGDKKWSVDDCASREEAARFVAEWAEMDGVTFRRHWWEFWRPIDPRDVIASTGGSDAG